MASQVPVFFHSSGNDWVGRAYPERMVKGLALMLLIGNAFAQQDISPNKDPTVPPAVWLEAQPGQAGAGASVQDSSRVRVVVVGRDRRIALIDGKTVQAGDVVEGEKVVDVNAKGVIMEDSAKTLDVTPNVEKKPPEMASGKKKIVMVPEDGMSSKQLGSKQ